MLRLYVRFYLALLASLALFGLAAAALWHLAGGPMEQAGITLARVVQNALPSADASPDRQQDALRRLASGLDADVTLFARDGTVIAAIGRPLPPPQALRHHVLAFAPWGNGTVSGVHLGDGRLLVASVPIGAGNSRMIFHSLLLLVALAIGVAAFPIARQLTRRLERLQRGVESLGAGDLAARVGVEGHDEVARLAASFNRAAGRIEQLVRAHQSLLANASHELRTPLTRIRLAVEMLKGDADPKCKAGLEKDIAELDELVDEILLASRLNAIDQPLSSEDIDLLALAAEECSRYDHVQLEGAPVEVRGDARLLRRLMRNLLENAKRHGAPPTQVQLQRQGASVILKVWDRGAGPAPAEFEQVFTPFYRRRDGSHNIGNGLGLSLVRQIARRHGGDAQCTPMDDGRGCFVITLAGADV
ncbi:MAG TPA: ATP-binding protein [Steroidobacteraceae bacterium]|nr:ATP-binding protein [Steroidobacteraceae bacterium]